MNQLPPLPKHPALDPAFKALQRQFQDAAIAMATQFPGVSETADKMANPHLILAKLREVRAKREAIQSWNSDQVQRRRQAVVGIDGPVDKIQADTMIPL